MLVTTPNLTVNVLHFANFTNFFLSIWKAICKQFNFTLNQKSSGKMESVTMVAVAEENQKECLVIQDQANGGVHVSMEAEVSHCPLLAKRSRRRNEACTETEKDGESFCM